MAEPTDGGEKNGKSQNAASEQGRPQETPQGGGLPDVSKTVRDVRTLWGKAVSPDASPGSSIKAGGIGAGLEAASKLLPRLRRLSKAKEEKEKPEESDFELIELLGKGGMGMVFLARQKSLDREVAVKVIQPTAAEDAEARGKFFAEALVTGELDHPNIVPVYDFGGTPEGVLFYPMKQVRGTSWDKVIQRKSLEENLSILNSVCDAVAFAHDKGVIHRDLKPENVMLGDYGEVYVMDWGLAASVGMEKAEKLTPETGFAGTPAYMAPEIAKCEPTRIGPASDIYLLGGILYEIVTGLRPHTADDVYSCIHAATQNVIQPTEKKGELVEIGLKAMATQPENRHKSVKDFQRAIREYRSHAESLKLSAAADERLSRVKEKPKTEVYRELTETIAGYRQAIELWLQNECAILGLRKARETFVEVSLERGDLTLAQSQVAAMEEECGKFVLPEKRLESPKALAAKVSLAIAQAARKEKIARLSRRAAIAAASLVLIVSLAAYFITKAQRNRALTAEKRAIAARAKEAEERRRAERENYYNIIALAEAKSNDLAFDEAETLLWNAPVELRGWEWGRLMRVCHPKLLALKCDSRSLWGAAFSPDGKRIATVNGEIARVWDTETGRITATLARSQRQPTCVAFSPHGRHIAIGDSDGSVSIWDAESGVEIQRLTGHSQLVRSVAFSADGRLVATGSDDGTAKVCDPQTGQDIATIRGHEASLTCVAFSPDGRRLATASHDCTVRVWDPETGQTTLKIGASLGGNSVAFSPDGKRLLIGCSDGSAGVYDAQSGQNLALLVRRSEDGFPVYGGTVTSAAFAPDGERLVTGSTDSTATVWEVLIYGRTVMPTMGSFTVASYDGKEVLVSSRQVVTLRGHSREVSCVAFSPDGRCVLTGSSDSTARLWDSRMRRDLLTPPGDTSAVTCLALSPDGRRLITGGRDGVATVWDAETGDRILDLKGHRGTLSSVAFSADGKRVATGSSDATARLWHVESGGESLVLRGHSDIVQSVETARDGSARETRAGAVRSLAFSPDGTRVVTGSNDKTAKVWDAGTGAEILTMTGHSSSVTCVAFSPDGRRLATASRDDTVRVWDPETGQGILTVKVDSLGVNCVAFSPDGKRIVTGGSNGAAKIWDAVTGREAATLRGHATEITSAVFSPDGRRVVTRAQDDRAVKIWDPETGRELLSPKSDRFPPTPMAAFSADGGRLAINSDNSASIWDAFDWNITPEELEKEQRERYRRWLERNRETAEAKKAAVIGQLESMH